MLYLEDYLELIEQLPGELRDRGTEMRMLDLQVQSGLDQVNKSLKELFEVAPSLAAEERERRFQKLLSDYGQVREHAAEKVTIAETMYNLVEKFSQKLNKEIMHFKYELEADNPGVTEQIENKFDETARALFLQRRERRKRAREVSQSTPTATNGNIETPRPHSLRVMRPAIHDGKREGSAGRASSIGREDELKLRGMVSERDYGLPPLKKRSTTNPNRLIATHSSPSLHPHTHHDKVAEHWDVSVPTATTTSTSSSVQFALNSARTALTTHLASAAGFQRHVGSPGPSLMTFCGQESRHGRPRKLTSRAAEMLADSLQRHERRANSHNTPDPDDDESDSVHEKDDNRLWCFCKKTSFGTMIACDNNNCPIEWFHYDCLGLTEKPRGKWYCPLCVQQRRSLSKDV